MNIQEFAEWLRREIVRNQREIYHLDAVADRDTFDPVNACARSRAEGRVDAYRECLAKLDSSHDLTSTKG